MYEILISDLLKFVIPFIILINLIATISIPFTNLFFIKDPDRGYGSGYILGTVIISWIYFLICTLAYIFEIDFLRLKYYYSLIISVFIWIGVNYYLFKKSHSNWSEVYKFHNFKTPICLSVVIFLLFYFINSVTFEITPKGSENFMNLGILNAIFYSDNVPINDFWYSGESLNYYYFGHFIFATILKLLNLNPNEGFMFLICITPTLFLTALFNFVKKIYLDLDKTKKFEASLAGIFSIVFITFVSPLKTLQAIYEYLYNIKSLNEIYLNVMKYSVRVIDNTIAENYNYALFQNPLHAHTTNLILAIVVLNLIYNFFYNKEVFKITNKKIVLSFFLIGVMFTISSWDLLVYLGLFVFMLELFNFSDLQKNAAKYLKNLIILSYPLILGLFAWIIFYIPSAGIPALVKKSSSIDQFLGFWGLYFILIIISFIYNFNKPTNKFLNYLIIFSFLVLIFLEVIYISDANTTNGFERANTYYKFANATILFLTISISIYFVRFLFNSKNNLLKISTIILILSTFLFNYILITVRSTNFNFRGIKNQEIILANYDQNLFEIFQFFQNIKAPNLVVLEGGGRAYTKSNFISTLTGIPTVFGWDSHEYTWRYNKHYLDKTIQRLEDVKTIYTSDEIVKTKELLNLYKVNYIILSKQEREIYKDKLKEEKLLKMGEIVFQKENNYIIKR